MEKDFLKIIEEHQNIIYKVCRMYRDNEADQEDLFQDIVLQLWKAFPDFRKESKVSTWMYRIALNTAIAVFRKKTIPLDFKENIPEKFHPTEKNSPSENEEKMFAALRQLNDAEKAIISLYLEDYSHREIADIIGITENYVGVRISRIKTKLKNILN
ncbi:RNA polymerase sigma factor [soil metagenome]